MSLLIISQLYSLESDDDDDTCEGREGKSDKVSDCGGVKTIENSKSRGGEQHGIVGEMGGGVKEGEGNEKGEQRLSSNDLLESGSEPTCEVSDEEFLSIPGDHQEATLSSTLRGGHAVINPLNDKKELNKRIMKEGHDEQAKAQDALERGRRLRSSITSQAPEGSLELCSNSVEEYPRENLSISDSNHFDSNTSLSVMSSSPKQEIQTDRSEESPNYLTFGDKQYTDKEIEGKGRKPNDSNTTQRRQNRNSNQAEVKKGSSRGRPRKPRPNRKSSSVTRKKGRKSESSDDDLSDAQSDHLFGPSPDEKTEESDVTDDDEAPILHKCHICFLIYASDEGLAKHLSTHKEAILEKSEEKVFSPEIVNEKEYKCEKCKQTFKRVENLRRHVGMPKPHPSKPWNCPQCSLYFTSRKSLTCHLSVHGKKLKYSKGKILPSEAEIIEDEDVAKPMERNDSVVAHCRSENEARLKTALSGWKEQEGTQWASKEISVCSCDNCKDSTEEVLNDLDDEIKENRNETEDILSQCPIVEGIHDNDLPLMEGDGDIHTNLATTNSSMDLAIANRPTGSIEVVHTPNVEVETQPEKSLAGSMHTRNKSGRSKKLPTNRIQTIQRRSSPRFNPYNVFNVPNLEEYQNPEGINYNAITKEISLSSDDVKENSENSLTEQDPVVSAPEEPSNEPLHQNGDKFDKLSSCSPYKPETEVMKNIKENTSLKRSEIPVTDKLPPSSSENASIEQATVTPETTEPAAELPSLEIEPDNLSASPPDNSISGQGSKAENAVQVFYKCPYCFGTFAEGEDLIIHLPTHSRSNRVLQIENVEDEQLEEAAGVGVKVGNLQEIKEGHKDGRETNEEVILQSSNPSEVGITLQVIGRNSDGNSKEVSNDMESSINRIESGKEDAKEDTKSMSNEQIEVGTFQIRDMDSDTAIQSENVNDGKCPPSVAEYYEEDDLFTPVSRKELKTLQDRNKDDSIPTTLTFSDYGGTLERDNDRIQNWLKSVEPSENIPPPNTPDEDANSTCTCDTCGKKLSSKLALQIHKRIHSGTKPFECQQCHHSFRQISNLRAHMKLHDTSRPFKCSQCGLGFLSRSSLQMHFRTHKKANEVSKTRGSSYSKTFEEGDSRASHKRPFKCAKCKLSFKHLSPLTNHVKLHDKSRPWKCRLCDFYFLTERNLTDHERSMHKQIAKRNRRFENVKAKTRKDQDSQELTEPSPRKSVASWRGDLKKVIKIILPKDDPVVRRHLKNQMELKQEKEKAFGLLEANDGIQSPSLSSSQLEPSQMPSNRGKLTDSYKQARATDAPDSKNVDAVEITGSGRRISGLDARRKILAQLLEEEDSNDDNHDHDIKLDEPPIPDEKDKLLENESSSATKLKTSTGRKAGRPTIVVGYKKMKTFSCTMCSDIFYSLESAKSHLITHTQVYKCPKCFKSFQYKSALKWHMICHGEVRPYKCLTCSKAFKTGTHLQNHIRTHSSEKPYKCLTCSTAFRQKGSLKKHILTHSRTVI